MSREIGMQSELVDFLSEHWILTLGLVVSLISAFICEFFYSMKTKYLLKNGELIDFLNKKGVVIDIRDKSSYDAGHIVGTKNIKADDLLQDKNFVTKNSEKNVVLVCEYGKKAWVILKSLEARGLQSVKMLDKGIVGWKQADMPITATK